MLSIGSAMLQIQARTKHSILGNEIQLACMTITTIACAEDRAKGKGQAGRGEEVEGEGHHVNVSMQSG